MGKPFSKIFENISDFFLSFFTIIYTIYVYSLLRKVMLLMSRQLCCTSVPVFLTCLVALTGSRTITKAPGHRRLQLFTAAAAVAAEYGMAAVHESLEPPSSRPRPGFWGS
jgi:hypothetical protein